jgi:hypothetical protein
MEAADRSLHRPRQPMTIAERTAQQERRLASLLDEVRDILRTRSEAMTISEIEHELRTRRLAEAGTHRDEALDIDTFDVREVISELKSLGQVEYTSRHGARWSRG